MTQEPPTEILGLMKQRQERIYASSKTEPLGRSMHRGHVLPTKTEDASFMFGKKGETDASKSDAKAVLYPVEKEDDGIGARPIPVAPPPAAAAARDHQRKQRARARLALRRPRASDVREEPRRLQPGRAEAPWLRLEVHGH